MRDLHAKPWFGPKRLGWGLRPVTWQGWLVTAVFVAAVILTGFLAGKPAERIPWLILEFAVFLAVAFGTSRKSGFRT